MRRIALCLAGLATGLFLSGMVGTVQADTIAISISGTGSPHDWPEATIGWEFTTSAQLNITALGVWDQNGDGLGTDYQVGIFDTSGTLLTSTTVTTANTLTDGFRYNNISPYVLNVGTYVVGAYFPDRSDKGISLVSGTTSSEITYNRNLFLYNNGFTLPTTEWAGYDYGNFGPNFQYTSIPIPSAAWLLGSGLIGFVGLRKKLKK